MKLSALYFATIISFALSAHKFKYDEYKVYEVIPHTLDEAKLLGEFENDESVDFWSEMHALDIPIDVMVSPVGQERFESVMEKNNIEYSVAIENVEEKIEDEDNSLRNSRLTKGTVSFDEFMRYDDIIAYLVNLTTLYPTIMKTEVLGKSFEGRDIYVVTISGGSGNPAIYAQSAIHAREWIAPPVALYMIQQLVENPNNTEYYRDVDWIIVPVLNPDGYEFSHDDVRLWRKTRTPGTICYGTDGNRNFNYQWMVTGASNWQCSQTYAGHTGFSEPETQLVRDYILVHRNHIKLFLDIHSYGNWILYPWGYTTVPPDDKDELLLLGNLVNDAIHSVRGSNYTVGNSQILLYATSGSGPDFAKGVAGIELSYTLELPRGGNSGFNPGVEDIQPVVEETWEGMKAYHDYIRTKFSVRKT